MSGRLMIAVACAAGLALGGAGVSHAKSEKAQDKAPGPAKTQAAGKDAGNDQTDGSSADVAAAAAAGAVLAGALLSDKDRATILDYYEHRHARVTALPPGIAKNLERGKPLPPGIAKRGVPPTLSRRLSIPAGYELQTVGADVLLIEIGTRIIADILKDAVHK